MTLNQPTDQNQQLANLKPSQLIFHLLFIVLLLAGGIMVFISYPVKMMFAEDGWILPWVVAIIVGLVGGISYTYWLRQKERTLGFVGFFSVISFGILGFWAFDIFMSIFPDLFAASHIQIYRDYLYDPKYILVMFAGGVGGLFCLGFGFFMTVYKIFKKEKCKEILPILLTAVYGLVSLVILNKLFEAGNMDKAIVYMKGHQTYNLLLDIFFGSSFTLYALRFLFQSNPLTHQILRATHFGGTTSNETSDGGEEGKKLK